MKEVESEQAGSQTHHSQPVIGPRCANTQNSSTVFSLGGGTEPLLSQYILYLGKDEEVPGHYPEKAIFLLLVCRTSVLEGLWPFPVPFHMLEHSVTDSVCLKLKNKTCHALQGISLMLTNLSMFQRIPYSKRRHVGIFRECQ